MKKEELKRKLHEMIDSIDDEQTLNVMREDMEIYRKADSKFDDLSDLTEEEKAELEKAVNEEPGKDTVSEEEFNNYIQSWRKRLSIRKDS